ncbi:MAG: hypothetical protein KKB59_18255 [Spirochaetes bacterium]|nr:hypothetical protein [Spirochaetota bacterium]
MSEELKFSEVVEETEESDRFKSDPIEPEELNTPEVGTALISPVQSPEALEVQVRMMKSFTNAVQVYKQFKKALTECTEQGDWLSYKETIQLNSDGALRIAAIPALQLVFEGLKPGSKPDLRYENNEDGTYTAIIEGYVFSQLVPERRLYSFGRCFSDNKFFLRYDPNGNPLPINPRKVEVVEKAFANFYVRAVSKYTGLWHPTKEMLIAGGIDPDQITAIEYKSRKPERDSTNTSIGAVAKLKVLITQISALTGEVPEEILKRVTMFTATDGKTLYVASFGKLTDRWAGSSIPKAEKELKELRGEYDPSIPPETGAA